MARDRFSLLISFSSFSLLLAKRAWVRREPPSRLTGKGEGAGAWMEDVTSRVSRDNTPPILALI